MRLQDRVAIVTGGASGMGKATVHKFLDEGAKVVIADFNEQTGEETVAEAVDRNFGDRVRFVKVDVAQEDDIVAMMDCAREAFGRIDIVFNNAGVGGGDRTFDGDHR